MILLAGIVLGQVVLYGPSLAGRKVLLPLEDLAGPGMYVPRTSPMGTLVPSPASDLILQFEPSWRFAVSELHAGRFPMWAPYHFAGAAFICQKFSPFPALQCCSASPIVLPWAQLFAAIVAGVGAYLFFRRVLDVGFWPAAICWWCYPMTGFFVFWPRHRLQLPAGQPRRDVRLKKLASPEFDPRDVAYVEAPIQSPAACSGKAQIIHEVPTRITISVNMETPGLVVLADLWDKGWPARLDGTRVPILRVNHAIRGVLVPPGSATLEFHHEPASLAWGLVLSGGSSVVLLSWLAIILRKRRLPKPAYAPLDFRP